MGIENWIRQSLAKGVEALAGYNRKRLREPAGGNPFLTGIHAPMTEEATLTELSVTGTIPAGLDGRYLRIGPNPVDPDPASYHWFSGDGMVHGLAIENGRALWYRNRWIRSDEVAAARGVEPAPGPRHDFDMVNTNVVSIGGRTFALVEAGSYPVELSESLEAQTYNPFDGSLKGSFTAHPHRDPKTGEYHAVCYEARDPKTIRHVVIDANGRVVREEPVAVKHGPMVHDCAITDRFVLILDLPLTFSVSALISGYSIPYRWNTKHEARIGLMPRAGSDADIIWCDVDPCYAFHVVNAYDLPDGSVVADLCVYESMFHDGAMGPDARSLGLERWTIDPVRRTVDRQAIDATPQEFPRQDDRFYGQPHRYVWTMALPAAPLDRYVGGTAIYAHDLIAGSRQVHDFGAGRFPGEFVFVPEAADCGEGQGWLIGLVIDTAAQTTDLVILDARRFEDDPVASIRIPHRIPPGFHGNWVSS
ncbi:carotenoid oxygenase family protein [Sphingomonas sp. RP10(2022)]|uniref:Dioxygenase n=1 Tax=Sphingomonas liriopis TaxID=2949094 RepID=A0A9X2HZ68_9SPHN|nr:carotenoid oxygenase family protein [Sphingomonas liriopis]MCP3736129.1 carotenoid oxygenase family protein [Sphingomonas liriopis]